VKVLERDQQRTFFGERGDHFEHCFVQLARVG
jgi:hypothetical protein